MKPLQHSTNIRPTRAYLTYIYVLYRFYFIILCIPTCATHTSKLGTHNEQDICTSSAEIIGEKCARWSLQDCPEALCGTHTRRRRRRIVCAYNTWLKYANANVFRRDGVEKSVLFLDSEHFYRVLDALLRILKKSVTYFSDRLAGGGLRFGTLAVLVFFLYIRM